MTSTENSAISERMATLEASIETALNRRITPGIGIALVVQDHILCTRGFGLANFDYGIAMTDATPIHLASVSKVITGMAVMSHLISNGMELDEDINGALDFVVKNPYCPAEKITYRQLLTHTSSIIGNASDATELRDCLVSCLTPGGSAYRKKNYLNVVPGKQWQYGNYAVALAGYAVGCLAKAPFDDIVRTLIFKPLAMESASWWLAEMDLRRLAVPHRSVGGNSFEAVPHSVYPDWPSGLLHASVADLAKIVVVALNGGRYNDVSVLDPEINGLMLDNQLSPDVKTPDGISYQGLIWEERALAGSRFIGKSGGDPGICTEIVIDTDAKVGAVVLMNVDENRRSHQFKEGVLQQLIEIGKLARPSQLPHSV